MSAIVFVFFMVFFFSAVILTVTVPHLRGSRIQVAKFRDELNSQSQDLIMSYIFDHTVTVKDINNFFKENKHRHVFNNLLKGHLMLFIADENTMRKEAMLQQLMQLHKNFKGEIEEKIIELYNNTDLKKYSFDKLKNKNWNIIVHGIRELTEMNEVSALDEIIPFANDKNQILHTEAQMAVIYLSQDKELTFLNELTQRLTIWEQMHILSAIEAKGYDFVPDFTNWVESKNNSVVLFAINMIAYFKQDRALGHLTKLMNHQDPDIRIAAIKTMGSFINQNSPESVMY